MTPLGSTRIKRIRAREILDSRGRPTVEADVELSGGALGRAAVPSGASTGSAEAFELRDDDPERYDGRGVLTAVGHVNGVIAQALRGQDALAQSSVDARLRELDGTPQLRRFGANAVLAVSLGVCRAAAAAQGRPTYDWIAELASVRAPLLPLPMVNILSGGLHANCGMDIQDFLAIPLRATSIGGAVETMSRVRTAAGRVAERRGLSVLLADEGGISPGLQSAEDALNFMIECIEEAKLKPGLDVAVAIDVAATGLRETDGHYRFRRENLKLSAAEMIARVDDWARKFPVVSVEDPLAEEDWDAWAQLTRRVEPYAQIIGDDLFATQLSRLERGIAAGAATGILIKLNQNGTLTGTLEVIAAARSRGYRTIVSARSGETEDAFMADLAVGTAAGQIKIGSLRTSSTVSKYNQLLRIEEGGVADYAGAAALRLSSIPLPMGSSTESSRSSRT